MNRSKACTLNRIPDSLNITSATRLFESETGLSKESNGLKEASQWEPERAVLERRFREIVPCAFIISQPTS